MDPAIPIRLSDVSFKSLPMKVRIAGRLSSYDVASTTMVLTDNDERVLVDVSLCIDPFRSSPWLREANALVVTMGYLERIPPARATQKVRYGPNASKTMKNVIFRALLIREAGDLQLSLWYEAIEHRRELMEPNTT